MLGIYDSGVGGITILQNIQEIMPNVAISYLADTLSFPFGSKSPEEINTSVQNGLRILFDSGCSIVILACNTATCLTIRDIQQNWLPANYPGRKVLGIVRPVSEQIISQIKNPEDSYDKVLLLGTQATIKSGFYQEELARQGMNHILSVPMKGLAEAIELNDRNQIKKAIDFSFAEVSANLIGTTKVILACTHYPIVQSMIKSRLTSVGVSPNIEILNQAQIVSQKLFEYVARHPEFSPEAGQINYFSTSNPDIFSQKLFDLFGIEAETKLVDLPLTTLLN